VTTVPLLISDDLGMRKLPITAAEDLLEIIMRRHERASTLLTSNGLSTTWGSTRDHAGGQRLLDRLCIHGHVLSGPEELAHEGAPTWRKRRTELGYYRLGSLNWPPFAAQLAGFEVSIEEAPQVRHVEFSQLAQRCRITATNERQKEAV